MKKTEEPAESFDPRRPRHFKPGVAGRDQTETPEDRNLALCRSRLRVAAFAFIAAFSAISLRLADVTLLKTPDPEIAKLGQTTEVTPPHFSRADIVDRNGVVLATTLQIASLFANPKLIDEPAKVAHQLAGILPNSNEQELYARLSSGKSFVWLQRRLTPQQEAAINALGVPGLDFQHEEQRIYPQGALASHVVGYTDLDGKGLAGIERSFNNALGSSHDPLKLTIDIRLQAIVREELQKQIQDFNGIGGTGIVMNVKTGEILSMISLPDFDPNDMNTVVPATIFNRATLGVYEMGSVFKIFNTSLALNNGTAWLSKMYDVSPIHIGRFIIHDDEPQSHPINVARIFQISSNIGSAHMAMEVGSEKQKAFLGSLGLLRPPSIEIPEIGMPQAPRIWHDINTMTIAFGQGIAVSPIQLAVAANAVADGGIFRPATLIKPPPGFDPPGQRILPENVALTMRKLLRLVVTDGTGRKANVPGYWVGGKTGSAQKVLAHGGYAKKSLISSFISFFPMNDPQYMVYVLVDEPHGNKASYGFATGGWVGAPLAGRIIARMAPLFGLKPIPETPELDRQIVVDPNAPGGAPPGSKKIAAN